jgi:hypothetical protein
VGEDACIAHGDYPPSLSACPFSTKKRKTMKKLPEMLVRWNIFEKMFSEILQPIRDLQKRGVSIDPSLWEEATRRIDQAVAATTCRGEQLRDTSEETVNIIWDAYEIKAKATGDKRALN